MKWSYVSLNEDGYVSRVAEKQAISDFANVGVYYYSKGSHFISAAENMIEKNIRTNGEFYIAETYNQLILSNKKIVPYLTNNFYGLGTPEDLDIYLKGNP